MTHRRKTEPPARGHPLDLGGVALLNGEVENPSVEYSSPSHGLPSDILNLFCKGAFAFWRWRPRTDELMVDGKFDAATLEEWMTKIHPRDHAAFTHFLDQEWDSIEGTQAIDYRFRTRENGEYETVRHTAVMNRDGRQITLAGLVELLPSRQEDLTQLQQLQRRLKCLEAGAEDLREAVGLLCSGESLARTLERFRSSTGARAALLFPLDRGGNIDGSSTIAVEKEFFLPSIETALPELVEEALSSRLDSCRDEAMQFPVSFDTNFRGYVSGTVISDGANLAVAFLAACYDNDFPVENRPLAESFLSIAAGAISLEMQRQAAISKWRSTQEEIIQAQKLASLGKLSSGVAHDFNNLLTVIQGHTTLIRDSLGERCDDRTDESLDLIRHASEQAVDLARQLLLLSRQQTVSFETCRLNEIVRDFLKMMRRVVEENIEFHISLDPDLLPIRADRSMIGQVLMNLIVNARDAMPDGGAITIETRNVELTGDGSEHAAGRYVSLTIEDTGCGMDPEQVNQIFDPFFTTKEEGKGTGLGLANVSAIVSQHHGYIDVTSAPKAGTKFEILIPVTSSDAKTTDGPPPVAEPGSLHGATILLVEDESAVRKLVRKLLEMLGATVIEASSGKRALEIWPEVRDRVSLVVTDVVMPEGVSGWDLARELHRNHPDLGILLTSGYSENPEDHNLGETPRVAFLQKPYETKNLRTTLCRLLDKGASVA